MPRSTDRVVFVLSLMASAFFYGWGAHQFGWFPDSVLTRALGQARHLLTPPEFVSQRVYRRTGVRVRRPAEMAAGVTLVTTFWEDSAWRPGLRLLDDRGRSLHHWRIDPPGLFPRSSDRRPRWSELGHRAVDGAHLFPNGDVLFNVEYVGTARVDACGEVQWRLPTGGHHSIARAGDGSFWIPALTHEGPAASARRPDGFPGLEGPLRQDLLLRVAPDGTVRDTVNVLDVLYDNGLQRYIVKTAGGRPGDSADVTHVNDAEPLPAGIADEYPLFEAGDLAVSLRNLNLVLVLDPDSRRVKWHATGPFIQQHDPDYIGDGWIGILDNNRDGTGRGEVLGGSRVVALQPHTDSTRVLFPGPDSPPFYTRVQGKWQLLPNGNMLLTESQAGRALEVGPGGRAVWEWVNQPYSSSLVPYLSGAHRYDLTAGDVSSWPCPPEAS